MTKSKKSKIWVVASRVVDFDDYSPTVCIAVVDNKNAAKRRLAALAQTWNVADGPRYHVAELVDGKSGAKNAAIQEGYGHIGERIAWRAKRGAYDGCRCGADGVVVFLWE